MTNNVVTMSAKRDAVKFSTLVNGKRRTIFFDSFTTTQLLTFLTLKGKQTLSRMLSNNILSNCDQKKYTTSVDLSLDQFTILKGRFFRSMTYDNYWKVDTTSKSNGQYAYVTFLLKDL